MLAVLFGSALCAAAATLFWLRHRYVVVVVQGDSMAPTLRHGQRVVARRGGDGAQIGDIVVFPAPPHPALTPPEGEPGLLVKRVVASDDVAGERLIVLGDNRAASQDSRLFGPIDRGAIVGIARAR
ncbi:MAG: S26 family signal peptidase [Archangiaceae bacterium]|nr:S26 family signal peptidase [Archangiaceae bacterium]